MLTDIGAGLGAAGLATDVFALSNDSDTQKAGRITGWVLLGTFAASAVYGTYVTIECQSSAPGDQRREEQARALAPTKAASFPGQVLQFQFGTAADAAIRACASVNGKFEPGASSSFCRSPALSLARPDVRLEFAGRELSRISLIYPATAETLRSTLNQIANQAIGYYGQPRSGPKPWPPGCASDGALQCLESGEQPGRAFWGFSDGDIELRPLLDGERLFVALRYSHHEPGG